jgi:hypothetical protein
MSSTTSEKLSTQERAIIKAYDLKREARKLQNHPKVLRPQPAVHDLRRRGSGAREQPAAVILRLPHSAIRASTLGTLSELINCWTKLGPNPAVWEISFKVRPRATSCRIANTNRFFHSLLTKPDPPPAD